MLGLHSYQLSLVVASSAYYPVAMCGLFIALDSLVMEQRLWSTRLVAVSHVLRCMWTLLGSGIKAPSPAMDCEFLTPGPPGKPHNYLCILSVC